jgi:BirA family biotin operon repressor/biotin-[acetyl-CoA-carboxylase] ligase
MQLDLSRAVAENLEFVERTGSTNADLVARAAASPHFSVIVTTNQTSGRGRLGRVWVAPPGKTIAVSVLLKPGEVQTDRLGWLPLLAGVAMTETVHKLIDAPVVALKWPNDVQVAGLKVSGLLAEYVPAARSVVIGAGLNLTMTADEVPTHFATSLTDQGDDVDVGLHVATQLRVGGGGRHHEGARLVRVERDRRLLRDEWTGAPVDVHL